MRRFKNTASRIFSISLKRLLLCVRLVRKESKKPGLFIFLDMLFCYLRYGTGYLDYLTFGFYKQDKAKRKTFMNMNQNLALVRKLNPSDFRGVLDNKLAFNHHFSALLKREYLDLNQAGLEAFENFLKEKTHVFVKQTDGFGGKGVERVDVPEQDGINSLYGYLKQKNFLVVEQEIIQHPEMDKLSDSSVNSIRITTLEKNDEIHIVYALVRMSDGVGFVDNISSGGMYCPVDSSGTITAPAFCDLTGEYYETHPKTHTVFVGFKIPFFLEATLMVEQAARMTPLTRYVGWDVAITRDGPALIEGNSIPGYDMCQNYRHLNTEKTGILPRFKDILKDEFPVK